MEKKQNRRTTKVNVYKDRQEYKIGDYVFSVNSVFPDKKEGMTVAQAVANILHQEKQK